MAYNPTLTPAEDFALRLEPNYREYLCEPTADHRAGNVISSVVRFYEWGYEYLAHNAQHRLAGASSLESFRKQIFAACPDLAIVHDLDNGLKHRVRRQPSRSHVVCTATDAFLPDRDGFTIEPGGERLDDVLARSIAYLLQRFGLPAP